MVSGRASDGGILGDARITKKLKNVLQHPNIPRQCSATDPYEAPSVDKELVNYWLRYFTGKQ